MTAYHAVLELIVVDPGYRRNVGLGRARPGHPEGTMGAHIAELERNLGVLKPKLSETDYWKLKVLVHTHDTFKPDALRGVPIMHPQRHASLARAFLAEYCADEDLLPMVQHQDEPFALWRQFKTKGSCSPERLQSLLRRIKS